MQTYTLLKGPIAIVKLQSHNLEIIALADRHQQYTTYTPDEQRFGCTIDQWIERLGHDYRNHHFSIFYEGEVGQEPIDHCISQKSDSLLVQYMIHLEQGGEVPLNVRAVPFDIRHCTDTVERASKLTCCRQLLPLSTSEQAEILQTQSSLCQTMTHHLHANPAWQSYFSQLLSAQKFDLSSNTHDRGFQWSDFTDWFCVSLMLSSLTKEKGPNCFFLIAGAAHVRNIMFNLLPLFIPKCQVQITDGGFQHDLTRQCCLFQYPGFHSLLKNKTKRKPKMLQEADENGYFEPQNEEDDGDQSYNEQIDAIGLDDFVEREGSVLDKKFAMEQSEIEKEVAKRATFYNTYKSWWDLRDRVDPNSIAMPTEDGAPLIGPPMQHQQARSRMEQSLPPLTPDCADILGDPICVIAIFVVSMAIFAWGCIAALRYALGKTNDMSMIWWQCGVSMMFITVMSLVLPIRLRFSKTLYGVASVMLLAQYAVFAFLYPFVLSNEDLVLFQRGVAVTKSTK
jgi:hypothetical protein